MRYIFIPALVTLLLSGPVAAQLSVRLDGLPHPLDAPPPGPVPSLYDVPKSPLENKSISAPAYGERALQPAYLASYRLIEEACFGDDISDSKIEDFEDFKKWMLAFCKISFRRAINLNQYHPSPEHVARIAYYFGRAGAYTEASQFYDIADNMCVKDRQCTARRLMARHKREVDVLRASRYGNRVKSKIRRSATKAADRFDRWLDE